MINTQVLQAGAAHGSHKIKQFLRPDLVRGWTGKRVCRGKNVRDQPGGSGQQPAAFLIWCSPGLFQQARENSARDSHYRFHEPRAKADFRSAQNKTKLVGAQEIAYAKRRRYMLP